MADTFSHDVFLSHSAKDKAVMRPLAERLRQDGLKVWFDEWVLKPGDSIPAKAWQERMEKLRAELQTVDPTRKSPALWLFVDMMEDMCPRLPDMLGALKDIVMKRGFEEITKDGFQEVIARLPSQTGT